MMMEYHRNATIFAGIFTTLQGAIWAFISVYSLGVYSCNFDFPFYNDKETTVGDLMYFSYFTGRCRYSYLGEIPKSLQNLVHPHRTYILMTTYGIVSAVWIPSSVLILVIAVNKIHGKRGARCYWPWIITTGAFLVLDIVATIIYSVDISHSMTTQDYVTYFSYPFPLTKVDGLTVIPAVLMTILSCRGVIIYIINLILFLVVIQASNALRRLSPAAAFVESDIRLAPNKNFGERTSNWVHIKKPALEHYPATRPEVLDQTRPTERPLDNSEQRPERPNHLNLEENVRPPPPVLKQLPISMPSAPPPPPPFYNVYGKPTTPDSPQPAFIRSRSPQAEGINNKVPWSYMNPPQQFPKYIPEPDYTIHPQRTRPSITTNQSKESGKSSLPIRSEEVNKNVPWSYLPKKTSEGDFSNLLKKPTSVNSPAVSNTLGGKVPMTIKKFENNANAGKVM